MRDVPRAERVALNLARIDTLETFGGVEGLIFFATPDQLSGLAAWAFYDRNDPDTVSALFGSGCSSVITQVVAENVRGGYRSFLGLSLIHIYRERHDKTRFPVRGEGSYDTILANVRRLLGCGVEVILRINYTASNILSVRDCLLYTSRCV